MADKLAVFEEFLRHVPAKRIGNLLAEYVAESNHSSWDGFSPRDLTGIRNFLDDMRRYYQNDDEPARFDNPGFGGVFYFTKPEVTLKEKEPE